MARSIAEIEAEVRHLSPQDKERLLQVLVEELDGSPDSDVEAAWLQEIERRSREFEEGSSTPTPADTVLAKVRANLKANGG